MNWLRAGSYCAATAVALGAFGAHALTDRLSERAMNIYQTAVQYHFIHAIAIVAVGLASVKSSRAVSSAGAAFLIGIFLFSGSLYALALSGVRWLGAITPLGGIAYISGWILLGFYAGERRR